MVKIHGVVVKVRIYRSLKKRLMAFVDIQTVGKKVEAVIFPENFMKIHDWLNVGQVVSCKGQWVVTEKGSLLDVLNMEFQTKVI